jgi:signal transduction histidine kinase
VDLGHLFRDVHAMVEPQAAAKGLQLVVADGDGLPVVRTDAGKVRQILLNLLSNAVKFTPPGGSVTVSWGVVEGEGPRSADAAGSGASRTREPFRQRIDAAGARSSGAASDATCPGTGGWAVVTVEDTGIGIDTEEIERIFQPFVQLDSGYTREHGGAGLVLTISRPLARLMGGELSVESTPGAGSRFTLWLPRPAPDRAPAGAAAEDVNDRRAEHQSGREAKRPGRKRGA